MLKKITQLACLGCLMMSAAAFADDSMSMNSRSSNGQGPEIYEGGVTLGTTFKTDSSNGIATFLTLGYINDCFLIDVGGNFTNWSLGSGSNSSDNKNFSDLMGHLGLRNQVYQNLYVTYGAEGSVLVGNVGSGDSRPWSVGGFLGLDLQITKHFLLSSKLNVYEYRHVTTDVNTNNVFSAASFGFSYVF